MATIAEINEVAKDAINQAMQHYFVNLAVGENKIHETQFLAELLIQTQGWLVFGEESLQNIQSQIYKDSLYINLIYTLTALFRSRFVLPKEDYKKLIEHLANSFNTKECEDENLSFMSPAYRARIPDPETIVSLLINNHHLVMLLVFYTYADTNVLAEALK